jgi:(p)ppGpp synthase/HD superfamily hydrolase
MGRGNLLDLIGAARAFAAYAHEGQVRKYTGEPYIVHPVEVMEIVNTVTDDEEVLAAALLHDVVEDTSVTVEDLRAQFGDRVATLVDELTDKSRPEDGNRKVRKAIDRAALAEASADAQTIKLADMISNTRSIVENDPKFAKVYLEEKRLLLTVLKRGDADLHARARVVRGGE